VNFFLGYHNAAFLRRAAVPACVSYSILRRAKALPRPNAPVFFDSRGFTEVTTHGRYTFTAREYAAFAGRLRREWGPLQAHASVMDWMCEDKALAATGRSVAEHQALTVNSWLALNALDGSVPWVPVLQGRTPADYLRHADLYARLSAADLRGLPLVGVGSVCRRERSGEIRDIVSALHAAGFENLHGFGVKSSGLASPAHGVGHLLASADSMAWSYGGRRAWRHRRENPCGTPHLTARGKFFGCGNCLPWALKWRRQLLSKLAARRAA
jgi:hypothetical protein